jgi:hypothetical protein
LLQPNAPIYHGVEQQPQKEMQQYSMCVTTPMPPLPPIPMYCGVEEQQQLGPNEVLYPDVEQVMDSNYFDEEEVYP